MLTVLKVLALSLSATACSKFAADYYVRDRVYGTTCILLLLGLYTFNREEFFLIMLIATVIQYLYIYIIIKLAHRFEAREIVDLQNKLEEARTVQGVYYARYMHLLDIMESKTDELTKSTLYIRAVSDVLINSGTNGYSQEDIDCVKLASENMAKPLILYNDMAGDYLNRLQTKKDYKHALRIIRRLKASLHIGDGFLRDLDALEKLLEKGVNK